MQKLISDYGQQLFHFLDLLWYNHNEQYYVDLYRYTERDNPKGYDWIALVKTLNSRKKYILELNESYKFIPHPILSQVCKDIDLQEFLLRVQDLGWEEPVSRYPQIHLYL